MAKSPIKLLCNAHNIATIVAAILWANSIELTIIMAKVSTMTMIRCWWQAENEQTTHTMAEAITATISIAMPMQTSKTMHTQKTLQWATIMNHLMKPKINCTASNESPERQRERLGGLRAVVIVVQRVQVVRKMVSAAKAKANTERWPMFQSPAASAAQRLAGDSTALMGMLASGALLINIGLNSFVNFHF